MSAGLAGAVRAATTLRPVPFVGEVLLHQADDPIEVWQAGELRTGRTGTPPPFWAFAWAGGQALSRYLLDHPDVVRGRPVLDLASGSGLVGIAAMLAGASAATCCDVDPMAAAAGALNAAANGVRVATVTADLLDGDAIRPTSQQVAEVVLAGDVFYERQMAARMVDFLRRASGRGATVLVGDPARTYTPDSGFVPVAGYDVPVVRALEDRDSKRVIVLRADPPDT